MVWGGPFITRSGPDSWCQVINSFCQIPPGTRLKVDQPRLTFREAVDGLPTAVDATIDHLFAVILVLLAAFSLFFVWSGGLDPGIGLLISPPGAVTVLRGVVEKGIRWTQALLSTPSHVLNTTITLLYCLNVQHVDNGARGRLAWHL